VQVRAVIPPVVLLASVAAAACPGCGGKLKSADWREPTRVHDLAVSPESLTVDKTGTGDGSFEPNGVPDIVLTVVVDGPAIALAVILRDPAQMHVDQWDTAIGSEDIPPGVALAAAKGSSTPGLLVFEGEQRISYANGAIAPLGPGRHLLKIYADASYDTKSPHVVQVAAQRADHAVERSNLVDLPAAR
jgi:hypothetical protein